MRIISWDEFNICIDQITSACRQVDLCGVYGVPRGGLCLAVALSHSLNIPLLDQLKPGSLVVDDVYETGQTFSRLPISLDMTTFVWFSKVKPDGWHAVEICNSTEWLIFPWENRQLAGLDQQAYLLSRGLLND